MQKQRKHESGQAMMELTIMLLVLAGMILAVVMISGIEISSNNMLLSARHNAQKNARSTTPTHSQQNSEISNWSYFKLDLTGKGFGGSQTLIRSNKRNYRIRTRDNILQIPFSYQSNMSANGNVNTMDGVYSKMTSAAYSKWELLKLGDQYSKWKNLQDFDPAFQNDFAESIHDGNAFNSAHLVEGTGDTSSGAATINARHQAAGAVSRDDAARVMYDSFRRLFGVRIDNIKMRDHETNKVYLPAQYPENGSESE